MKNIKYKKSKRVKHKSLPLTAVSATKITAMWIIACKKTLQNKLHNYRVIERQGQDAQHIQS